MREAQMPALLLPSSFPGQEAAHHKPVTTTLLGQPWVFCLRPSPPTPSWPPACPLPRPAAPLLAGTLRGAPPAGRPQETWCWQCPGRRSPATLQGPQRLPRCCAAPALPVGGGRQEQEVRGRGACSARRSPPLARGGVGWSLPRSGSRGSSRQTGRCSRSPKGPSSPPRGGSREAPSSS